MRSGQCLLVSAWAALRGKASPGRCGCAPLRVPVPAASVRVRVGGCLWQGAPGPLGVRAPPGAEVLSLRAGGAPRADPRARRSGAEPARGPEPQAEPGGARPRPRPQPEPAPPAESGSPRRAAEPRRRRRPWDAGIATPTPLSPRPVPGAPHRAASVPSGSPHPGAPARDPQVSERPRARQPRPGPGTLRPPPPNFPPRGSEAPACALPARLRAPGSCLPRAAPEGGKGRWRGADQPGRRGSPGRGGGSDRRAPPPLPFPSGFPGALSGAGEEELRPPLPCRPRRRLGEGMGLGPGFPSPETPRSERRLGAQ